MTGNKFDNKVENISVINLTKLWKKFEGFTLKSKALYLFLILFTFISFAEFNI